MFFGLMKIFIPGLLAPLLLSRLVLGRWPGFIAQARAFFVGMACVILVLGISRVVDPFLLGGVGGNPEGALRLLIRSFLVVSTREELLKALGIFLLIRAQFESPRESICIGLALGSGFATLENLVFLVGGLTEAQLSERLFFCLGGHLLLGGLWGSLLANPIYPELVGGALFAWIWHGLFDYLSLLGHEPYARLQLLTLLILLFWALLSRGDPGTEKHLSKGGQEV